jgi:hypothetical protein
MVVVALGAVEARLRTTEAMGEAALMAVGMGVMGTVVTVAAMESMVVASLPPRPIMALRAEEGEDGDAPAVEASIFAM